MNEINISKLNLNLIYALSALLEEANVSKAADKLDISQSAMSHSLAQLRKIFNDRLLVRGQSGKMSLTPLAVELEPKVNQAILKIKEVFVGEDKFDPSSAEDTFYIGISDYAAMVLLPSLTKLLIKEAPNIRLVVRHLNYLSDLSLFETGKLHLAIGNFSGDSSLLYKQKLFTDKPVCVAHKTHPAFKSENLNIEDYLKYPHVLVGLEEQPDKSFVLEFMNKKGYDIKVYAIVAHTLTALSTLVPNSNLIASTVERITKASAIKKDLIIKPFPISLKLGLAITSQFWHPRYANDPKHIWLRKLVKKSTIGL